VASLASTGTGSNECMVSSTGTLMMPTLRPSEHRRTFQIATYNVLTDRCIRPGQYKYCPEDIRYMSVRHVTIMAEVKEMSPDIICFQVTTTYSLRFSCETFM
jgi:mRNA deadenylase 3'-5' endonuclease subunit Ccr4